MEINTFEQKLKTSQEILNRLMNKVKIAESKIYRAYQKVCYRV